MRTIRGFVVPYRLLLAGLVALVLLPACAHNEARYSSSAVDYLYPNTRDPIVKPSIPVLNLPMRVGIAFVPDPQARRSRFQSPFAFRSNASTVLTEKQKIDLMKEVADHFKKEPFVKSIEVIPSAYLTPGGSFTNLDQIRVMYGLDVIALVSYDQVQFTDEGAFSLTYWTIVGAYVIPGEKNSTHTMMDTVIYDISSRKMLFRAPGTSQVKGLATPVNLVEQLRKDSESGFKASARQMIENLDQQLVLFQERVKAEPKEYKVVRQPGYSGGGSLGIFALLLVAMLGGYRAHVLTRRP